MLRMFYFLLATSFSVILMSCKSPSQAARRARQFEVSADDLDRTAWAGQSTRNSQDYIHVLLEKHQEGLISMFYPSGLLMDASMGQLKLNLATMPESVYHKTHIDSGIMSVDIFDIDTVTKEVSPYPLYRMFFDDANNATLKMYNTSTGEDVTEGPWFLSRVSYPDLSIKVKLDMKNIVNTQWLAQENGYAALVFKQEDDNIQAYFSPKSNYSSADEAFTAVNYKPDAPTIVKEVNDPQHYIRLEYQKSMETVPYRMYFASRRYALLLDWTGGNFGGNPSQEGAFYEYYLDQGHVSIPILKHILFPAF